MSEKKKGPEAVVLHIILDDTTVILGSWILLFYGLKKHLRTIAQNFPGLK